MDKLYRGHLTAITVLAVVAILVGACSSSATTAPGSASSASVGESPAAKGGTLSIAFAGDISTLDPAIGYDQISGAGAILLFDRLYDYDAKFNIIPYLAEALPTVSPDGTKYTIKLRKGVSFVNADGTVLREMTADDVVFSLNRVLDPNLKPAPSPVSNAFFGAILGAQDVISGKAKTASGVKALDANTIEVDLTSPYPVFLQVLASEFGSIVPKEFATEDTIAFSTKPVGSGPFVLTSYTKGQQAVFVRNPHYWQPNVPLLDEIDIKVGVDPNAALQQVQAGTLDVLGDGIPSGSFTSILSDPQYQAQIKKQVFVSIQYMWMDSSAPAGTPAAPLANPKVRQALNYAIDKAGIVKLVHGAAVVANCILPQTMPGYDSSCQPYSYDPAKAKQLLTEAGYPNGLPDTIKFNINNQDPNPTVAQAIQQDLAKVGVKIEIQVQTVDVQMTTITVPHAAPMGYTQWVQDYPDPSDFIDPILSCATAVKGGSNFAWYCNKQVDDMSAAAMREPDPQKRLNMYQSVQKAIMADAPWVPISNSVWYSLVSARVRNYSDIKLYYYDLRDFAVS